VTSDADVYDPNYDSIPSDPNYDLIPERTLDVADGGSDYDPNYESVTTLTASITGSSSSAARSPTEPGVAREITTAGSPAPLGNSRFPRREHIYQDIDEAKGGSSHSRPHTTKVAPHSTAL